MSFTEMKCSNAETKREPYCASAPVNYYSFYPAIFVYHFHNYLPLKYLVCWQNISDFIGNLERVTQPFFKNRIWRVSYYPINFLFVVKKILTFFYFAPIRTFWEVLIKRAITKTRIKTNTRRLQPFYYALCHIIRRVNNVSLSWLKFYKFYLSHNFKKSLNKSLQNRPGGSCGVPSVVLFIPSLRLFMLCASYPPCG